MKSILYIGNRLNKKQVNLTSIDVLGPLLEKEGYTLFYASSKTDKVLRILDMLRTCLMKRKKVDVVIMDTYSTQNFYYAFFVSQLCRWLKLKYIPILHGGNLPKRLQINPTLSKYIFNNAYKIVAPSLYLKNEFKRQGYKNVVHIPNTIQIDNYKFDHKIFDKPKMLWVRSFSIIYNPSLAVKILKALKDEDIDATLCMVGPDSDGIFQEIKTLAKALYVDIIFTGKLTKKEWINISKNYNIFINTTNFDNMPVSVIEAMALGLPIVSTNVGGMPFLIKNEEDGILIKPNNVNVFVEAIKKIMSQPETTTQMALRARNKVEQFDWGIVKERWFNELQ